jgi:hypothetical protein
MHVTHEAGRPQQSGVGRHARQLHAHDFFNLLTGDDLLARVEQHMPPHRERLYPPTDTLALFMAQSLNQDGACRQVVNHHAASRVASGLSACSTHTGAYCKARQRLPLEMLRSLSRETGQQVARRSAPQWRWLGRTVKLMDGTTVTLPDTPPNQATYPQQSNQKPGLGFSIMRVVGLLCAATGAVLDAAIGPYAGKTGSEHALFRQLLDSIVVDDLIVADRYYCAYFVIALIQARGADVVFQQHHRRLMDFRKGKRLGPRDHVVTWEKPKICPSWLTPEQYEAFPQTLEIREVQVKTKVLVTTLRCAKQFSKQALGDLYVSRWNVELDLRNIKTTLGMERLHCKTPTMNEKEFWVCLLAYNLIRLLMTESARHADVLPRRLSFKHSVQLWLAWRPDATVTGTQTSLLVLYALIAQQRVGDRPGRIEPRAVKRRPKPFPLLMKPRQQAREDIRLHGHPRKLK